MDTSAACAGVGTVTFAELVAPVALTIAGGIVIDMASDWYYNKVGIE